MPSSKMVIFSKENKDTLRSLSYVQDELVRGILSLAKGDDGLDCDDERFRRMLEELLKGYYGLKQEAQKGHIKDINPELERLISDINGLLAFTFQELQTQNPNGNVLTKYLVQLTYDTNKVLKDYSDIIHPRKRSILERLRESKLAKWMIGSIIGASLMGATYGAAKERDTIKDDKTRIEKKAEPKPIPEKAKIINAKEIKKANEENAAKNVVKKAESIRIQKIRSEYEYVKRNRKEVMAKVREILSRVKMPASYIQPKHIMALIWAESRFNPNAKNGDYARGIMQVYDAKASMDLEKNIIKGIERIKEKEKYCRDRHPDWDKLSNDRKIQIIFAAYNCGQSRLNYTYDWDVHESNSETESHDRAIWDYINYLHHEKN